MMATSWRRPDARPAPKDNGPPHYHHSLARPSHISRARGRLIVESGRPASRPDVKRAGSRARISPAPCLTQISVSATNLANGQIHPTAGPLEGGTLLTIEGSNLGSNEREIQDRIEVAGEPCQLVMYSVSTR